MYYDYLIECPNGFNPVIQELITKDLTSFVKYDEEDNPIGINGNKFYRGVSDFDEPVIVNLRASAKEHNLIQTKSFNSFKILAHCEYTEDVYSKLEEPNLALYNALTNPNYYQEFLEDEETPNPDYKRLIKIGRWM